VAHSVERKLASSFLPRFPRQPRRNHMTTNAVGSSAATYTVFSVGITSRAISRSRKTRDLEPVGNLDPKRTAFENRADGKNVTGEENRLRLRDAL
jgi:hypothetical protein